MRSPKRLSSSSMLLLTGGLLFISLLVGFSGGAADDHTSFQTAWPASIERTWVGPDFWANRLQDWRITEGRLEVTDAGQGHPLRTVHLLTRRLGEASGSFRLQVTTALLDGANADSGAATGLLVGAGGAIDYRSAALIHHSHGPGAGLFAGIATDGTLFFRDLNEGPSDVVSVATESAPHTPTTLLLTAEPNDDAYTLTLARLDADGQPAAQVTLDVPAGKLTGHVGLVAHLGKFRFEDWTVSGSKVERHDDRNAGPILGTQYTLSRQVMKLTAQLMPLGEADEQTVRLETRQGDNWTTLATTPLDVPSYTATFRIADWDDTVDTHYRVAYDLLQAGDSVKTYTWAGTIRRDPVDQDVVSVAGFTGNHMVGRGGVGQAPFDWNTRVWFPHTDLVESVEHNDVDVLFFSGDQVYEGASPTFADRQNAYLDYLYKWYLWSWSYRDLTKDRPTITIPDDHDVYQGNIWGQGGRPTDVDHNGGYVMPADWVKMVERTQTSHLPDPYDPTPIDQGIGVYYTSMTYGRIGFAILEDRKFKSGCAGVLPTEGRPDHITDPTFDPSRADLPGLKLLGDRQLAFLEDWASDWRGQDMKLAVSQTVFAGLATHHGPDLIRLYADLDSNGWPQSGRNRALHELRRGFAFMLGGDQHLSTLVQHGIDAFNDAGYSFAVPSAANFYPRAWMPEAEGANRPDEAPSYLGEHFDGLGNRVTVYGVTNPTSMTGESTGKEPLELHDAMPGYGIVRFNKPDRTITVENWPRYADPRDPSSGGQYEGWPRTIAMEANYGREAAAYLPTLNVTGMSDPVVQVVKESDGSTVYTLRINGTSFRPKVFEEGTYTVHVGDQDAGTMQTLNGLQALPPDASETVEVSF